ncbi:hypothetical protein [Mangrovihabitans endophyticus]|uniref:hypothetical protein n=1 Tax=Mangrovihabitans endophyticus TaxID=1751298 RepID=UPI00166366D8|nr:hypothetical protein [Mangrovihabitans endophyticus]
MSGLALLVGGTAVAAVAGGTHSMFATLLLGLLTAGMGHALLDEVGRQAGRRVPRWVAHDTVNAVLLSTWTATALTASLLPPVSLRLRIVCDVLALGYALTCGHFVVQRRRTIARVTREQAGAGAGRPAPAPAT